ncbi:serine protease gd-like isoform X1 [Vespa crabro]|uniref:serine protease gd-like isoform X1 n=2 Tax=Vespa crabro TaxID=7445 RepID=UPI001F029AB1|nr:serine protease gd-like isoform X1 [Vespa crabro]
MDFSSFFASSNILKMILDFGKCVFLIQLVDVMNEPVIVNSPCPKFFRYIRSNAIETMGQIKIPSPPKNVPLHLKIKLTVSALLPTKYNGRLKLAQSLEESVKAIQENRSLYYLVYFPIYRPIPILTGIWLNDQEYCSAPPSLGIIVTSIFLEHILLPPRILLISKNQGNNDNVVPSFNDFLLSNPCRFPLILSLEKEQPALDLQFPSNDDNTYNISNGSINKCCQRISNNTLVTSRKISMDQWPWMAAIFVMRNKLDLQCVGSLITNKHVITVAHCIKMYNVIVPINTMVVSLGHYHIRNWNETELTNRKVEEYRLHPDFKDDLKNPTADGDLAIIILKNPVNFSPFIRPVCLWSGSNDLEDVIGSTGYVVVWDHKDLINPYLDKSRLIRMTIMSQEDCLRSNAAFVTLTSNRTFCADSKNNNGPCNGDSGSGLLIRKNDGSYLLRGIVSRSIQDEITMSCDFTQYVVYVDIAKYLDWIHLHITI